MRDINAAAAMSRCSSFDDTSILESEMDTLNQNNEINNGNIDLDNTYSMNTTTDTSIVNNNTDTNTHTDNNISTLPRNSNGSQYSTFRTNTMAHVCWHRSCSIGRDEFEVAFGVSFIIIFSLIISLFYPL